MKKGLYRLEEYENACLLASRFFSWLFFLWYNKTKPMQERNDMTMQTKLLAWYEANARKLAFRQNRNPYFIWISEIMAQQTRIEAMLPYLKHSSGSIPICLRLPKPTTSRSTRRGRDLAIIRGAAI